MYKTLRKVLLLVLVSIAVVCGTVFAAACGKDDKDSKVTYSVTVTLDSDVNDVKLTDLKARWLSNSVAVSGEIALNAEGKAYAELDAGNYTVDLVGVPATAEYEPASVTALSPKATINVSKKAVQPGPSAQKLAKPTGLAISEGVLTWNAVEHASSYDVFKGSDLAANVAVASYTIPTDLAVGTYSYSVVAKGDGTNYTDSDKSDAKEYKVEAPVVEPSKLDAPVLTLVSDLLTWSAVSNASGYSVYDGEQAIAAEIESTVTSFNLANAGLSVGWHSITVVALGDGENYLTSDKSEPVNYEVKSPVSPDAVKLDKPTGLVIEDGILTWNAVEHASGYDVFAVADGATNVPPVISLDAEDELAVNLNMKLSIGVYSVYVVALGDNENYTDSDPSDPVDFEVEDPIKKLATPIDLVIEDGVLSWTGDENAVEYEVYLMVGSVSYEEAELVATVKVTSYTIPSDLEVGTYYYTVVAKSNGVDHYDSLMSEPVSYVVRPSVDDSAVLPEGGTEHYYNFGQGGEWQHQDGVPYTISAVGKYYIPVKFESYEDIYADVIKFTAPEDGDHSYIFSWEVNLDIYGLTYLNSQLGYVYEDLLDDVLLNNDENGELVFSLSKGDTVIIVLHYQDYTRSIQKGDDIRYEFTITSGDPIAEGSLFMPYVIEEIEDTHTAPEGMTEAYFVIPFDWSGNSYTVTFGEGVQIGIMYSRSDTPENLASGDWFTPNEYSATYIKATANVGTQISFTLEKAILPGTAEDPIELSEGEDTYSFLATWEPLWFVFTTGSEGKWYRFDISHSGLTVYSKLTYSEWAGYVGEDEDQVGRKITPNGVKDVYLEANHTYYIRLEYSDVGAVTLKLSQSVVEEVGILNPTALQLGDNEIDVSNTTVVFFVYTAEVEGKLNVDFIVGNMEGVSLNVYSDAEFSQYFDEDHPYGYEQNFSISLTNGTKVYILLEIYDYAKEEGYVGDSLTITLRATLKVPTFTVNSTSKKVTWTAVAGATGYVVYEGNNILGNLPAETLEYSLSNLAPGSYTIYVVAKGDGENIKESAKSGGKPYKYEVQLATPQNLKVEDGVISWDPVENASGYRIYVDNEGTARFSTTGNESTSWEIISDVTQLPAGEHTFYVTAVGNSGYTESAKQENGIKATVSIKADFEISTNTEEPEHVYEVSHLGEYVVSLVAGKTYTIILGELNNGDTNYASHFKVIDTGDGNDGTILTSTQASQKGDLIVPELTSTAVSFTVEKTSVYKLRFIDFTDFANHGCTVYFVEGDHSVEAPGTYLIEIDVEKQVSTPGNWGYSEYTFASDSPGWYEIVLTGDLGADYHVKLGSKDQNIDDAPINCVKSGLFEVTEEKQEVKLCFYTDQDAKTFTVLITYHHPSDMDLAVTNDADTQTSAGFMIGINEAIAPDNASALAKTTKLNLNNLVAGTKYVIRVEGTKNRATDYKLVYNGKQYDSYISAVVENAHSVAFEAVSGVNEAYIYSISVEGGVTTCLLKLVVQPEGDEPVNENGPAQGESKWLTPGTSAENAVELKFSADFVAGATYTLAITDSAEDDGLKLWWYTTYTLVYGDGLTVVFDYVNGDYSHKEATFVAGDQPVCVYASDAVNTKFEILVADVPQAGDKGLELELNGSVTFDVSEEHTVIALGSGLVHGTTYVLTGNFFAIWVNNGGLHLKYGEATLNFESAGDWENCKIEFTYSELVEPNVIEIFADSGCSWSDVTFTLTAK